MLEAQISAMREMLSDVFRPRRAMTVTEWAEEQLSLETSASNMGGPYRVAPTPYSREVMDSFADTSVERVVCCFGAQTAKTQSFLNGAAWALANEPGPAMWVMPNYKLADSFADTRLHPLLWSSEELREMRNVKARQKKTEIKLGGSLLTLVGSNSPANLSSRPVRLLILDEIDKFPMKTSKEANALDLAIERTRSFAEPKIFEASTPTTAAGQIWNEFLKGDQRRYFVPCPHCGKEILLVFNPQKTAFDTLQGCEAKLEWAQNARRDNGTWDYDMVAQTARFVCPHCAGKIGNESKTAMLRAGVWRPTNADADKSVRSYQLSTFYAPWAKAHWGTLAVEFLKAKNSVDGLRNFINSVCAEPDMGQWDGGQNGRRELIVMGGGTKPNRRVVIMTADRQKDYFWYVAREWYEGGNSELVCYGKADNFDDLKAQADKLGARFVGVDSGYETVDTNRECARLSSEAQPWLAMRGSDRDSWPHYDAKKKRIEKPYALTRSDPLIGTRGEGGKYVYTIMWSNPTIKDIVARFRDPSTAPVRWAIPQKWATDEYFKHLNGEYKKRVFDPKTGRARYWWVLRSSAWPNHLLDCECMNAAFALYLKILKNQREEEKE